MDSDRLEQLKRAQQKQSDAARPDIVTRVHDTGRLTARERLELLMDPDSDIPYGTIAAVDPEAGPDGNPWIAETGGLDALCTIDGRPAVVSTTDYTDHGGGYGGARLGRLIALAREQRWPLIAFVDGGGSRARHPRAGLGHIELSGAIGPYSLFDGMAELSGWVPTIAIVSGPSFAGHASVAAFSDIVIATAGSSIGMGGPPMVEAAIGKRLRPHELAPAEMQLENGGIEILVEDEHQAVGMAKRLLGFWHTPADTPAAAAASAPEIGDLISPAGSYPIQPVIEALVDAESFVELRGAFGASVVVGFARLGNRNVGIIASNPAVDEGRIDEHAAQKISRHVELCDAWELPIVTLVDTAGTITRWIARDGSATVESGLSRMHLRTLTAHQYREVPLLSVQLRLGRGLAPALMTGYSTGSRVPALVAAWPTAELNRAEGYAMVRDANAVDDVIEPARTRDTLIRLLTMMPHDRRRLKKQRPVDSW